MEDLSDTQREQQKRDILKRYPQEAERVLAAMRRLADEDVQLTDADGSMPDVSGTRGAAIHQAAMAWMALGTSIQMWWALHPISGQAGRPAST